MTALHDAVLKAEIPAQSGFPRLYTKIDKERDLLFVGPEGIPEPANGWIYKQCTGDGSATTFTFDAAMPANVQIVNTAVIVSVASATATLTVSLGKSGSTAAYHAASHFGSTMNATGAKTTTTVRGYETTAVTPLATFGAALDNGAKVLVGVQYAKVPAIV